ncbi:MAG: GntR family transcriptional regulator [Victivallaceae bacterium]|nr:GntR family transcriptional regulator [Victivallaceae bacterium]
MPKNINDDVQKLYQALKQSFQFYQPGMRLPTTRDLLTKYSCSRQTLKRALTELEKEKIIDARRRSGLFLRERVDSSIRRIIFVRVDWPCSHADEISNLLNRKFAMMPQYHFIEMRYSPRHLEDFIGTINSSQPGIAICAWLKTEDRKWIALPGQILHQGPNDLVFPVPARTGTKSKLEKITFQSPCAARLTIEDLQFFSPQMKSNGIRVAPTHQKLGLILPDTADRRASITFENITEEPMAFASEITLSDHRQQLAKESATIHLAPGQKKKDPDAGTRSGRDL